MDKVLAGLAKISVENEYKTDVKLVSEKLQAPDQIPKKHLPAVFPIDADEKREYAHLVGSSDIDLQGQLEVIITCVVYDRENNTRQQRTDLLRDVEKIMLNDSALSALVEWIEPVEVVTDRGTIPNFSVWDQTYRIIYRYNSADGG